MNWLLDNDFQEEDNEKIEIKEIPSKMLPAGIGYVVIPREVDEDEYKKDVMVSGRISIYGGLGFGFFHNVPVDREVLQRIVFPKKQGEYGSPIVWVNIPKHNIPVIVAILKNEDDYHPLQENQKRITKTNDNGDIVDIDMNPERNHLVMTVNGNKQDLKPRMVFKLNGKNNNCQMIFDVNGEFVVKSSDRVVIISEDKIEMSTSGLDNINKTRLVLDSSKDGQRFLYEDDKGNEIIADDEKILINAKESKNIILGDPNSEIESIAKGESLIEKLNELIDAITQITVPTPNGPSGTPVNVIAFKNIQSSLNKILSKSTKIE